MAHKDYEQIQEKCIVCLDNNFNYVQNSLRICGYCSMEDLFNKFMEGNSHRIYLKMWSLIAYNL